MSAKMETQLKELRDRMADLDTDVQPTEKETSKMATEKKAKAVKKAPTKVTKAPAKAEAPTKKAKKAAADDGGVNLKALAKEAKLEPHIARRQLRKAGIPNEGRWTWADGSPALRKAREALGLS